MPDFYLIDVKCPSLIAFPSEYILVNFQVDFRDRRSPNFRYYICPRKLIIIIINR